MTDLVTADLQLTDNQRDEYRHRFVASLPELADQVQADRVIILGDLTEQKDRHPANLVNKIVRYFHRLSQHREVIILRGNHDYLDEASPFFGFLRRFERIRFISKPAVVGKDLFLPHSVAPEQDWKDLKLDCWRWIFAHNIFTGATGAQGQPLVGIPTSIFPRHARVISGDVHTPQLIDMVDYVGAPYHCDFGDDYNPRVLVLDASKQRSVPVIGPRKYLLEFQWPKADWGDCKRGDMLKLRVAIKPKHMAEWQAIRDRLEQQAYKRGLKLELVTPIVEYVPGAKVAGSERRDDASLLKAYGRQREVDPKTLQTGLKIMEDEE